MKQGKKGRTLVTGKKPNGKSRLKGLIRLLFITLAVIYVFSRFIPAASQQDYPVSNDVDVSLTMALDDAFIQHLQFGTDIVFTYGPWGFLARGYHPQTHLLAVIIWSGLALVFMFAGWQFVRQSGCRRICAWLWLVLLAALATTPLGNDIDTRLLLFVTLLFLSHFFSENMVMAKACLVVALGCLSLVKFTGLLETAFVLCLVSVDDVFRRCRFPWTAPLWLASLLGFWVIAGQRLDSIGPFLGNSFQIVAGYTEAMALSGDAPAWSLLGYVTIAAGLWLLAARVMWLRLRRSAVVPLMGIGMFLFVAFKLGYVRHDDHQVNSAVSLLVLAALLLPLAWRESKMLKMAAAGLLVVTVIFGTGVFHDQAPGTGFAAQLAGTFRLTNLLAPVATACTGYLETSRQMELADIAAKNPLPNPLPPISGGADLYSYSQSVLFAYGLHYQPRPVIQSYSADTPALERMNAVWLRSGRAATNLLFAVQPQDARFPSLDDGLSWPELLTLYEINPAAGPAGPYLLLQRSAAPRGYRLVPLTNVEARFGTSLEIPALTTGPVWVEVDIKKTFAGKIISALYKPPALDMSVRTLGQGAGQYRLVPSMALAGFLLSPVVSDTRAFAALFGSDWPAQLAGWEARSMMIEPVTPSYSTICYAPTYQVRFYRLEFLP
jgi:hypothetical protein